MEHDVPRRVNNKSANHSRALYDRWDRVNSGWYNVDPPDAQEKRAAFIAAHHPELIGRRFAPLMPSEDMAIETDYVRDPDNGNWVHQRVIYTAEWWLKRDFSQRPDAWQRPARPDLDISDLY
jgi:hypothetical protein